MNVFLKRLVRHLGTAKRPYSLEGYELWLMAGNNLLRLCSLSVMVEVKVLLQIPSLYEIVVGIVSIPVTSSASL